MFDATKCIKEINNGIIEYGYIDDNDLLDNLGAFITIRVCENGEQYNIKLFEPEKYEHLLVRKNGSKIPIYAPSFKDCDLVIYKKEMGQGAFPYSFDRHHEAIHVSDIFEGRQKLDSIKHYELPNYMPYTFGLEFETSMGYIDESDCFDYGLMPLRDGSISGIEYSTIVLRGDAGLTMLEKQVELLKKNTFFNKDCALHIHMGGMKVAKETIWMAYVITKIIEYDLTTIVPPYSFDTTKYKTERRKNYCALLPAFDSFEAMYSFMTTEPYMGDLYQCHPFDVDRHNKWHVPTRYYAFNFINMLCYESPKTLEFRFLRPTYNFRIIYLWLWIFNAILKASEKLTLKNISTCNSVCNFRTYSNILEKEYIRGLNSLINFVYPKNISEKIDSEITLLKFANQMQINNGDFCGNDSYIMDYVFDEPSPLIHLPKSKDE